MTISQFLISNSKFNCSQSDKISAALDKFRLSRYDCLAVVDQEQKFCGIIHRNDFINYFDGEFDDQSTIADLGLINQEADIITCSANQPLWLRDLTKFAKAHRHTYIPAVDQDRMFLGFSYQPNGMALKELEKNFSPNICVVGMGYVGLTLAVALAEAGFIVKGLEIDPKKAASLRKGIATFYERDLQESFRELIKDNRIQIAESDDLKETNFAIITVGTPLNSLTGMPNIDYLDHAVDTIKEKLSPGGVLVLRSTVPVGTGTRLRMQLFNEFESHDVGKARHIVFAPERTLEGDALNELRINPQIIGSQSVIANCIAKSVFSKIAPEVIAVEGFEEAELVKLADNTSRDLHFAFANTLALASLEYGIDSISVIKSANKNYKRTNIALPSPGVGGPCLSKDPYLMTFGLSNLVSEAKDFLHGGRHISNSIMSEVAKKVAALKNRLLVDEMFFFGVAFKGSPATSDTRESTSIGILELLSPHFKTVNIWDPVVTDYSDLKHITNANFLDSWKMQGDICDRQLIVLANNSQKFRQIPWHDVIEGKTKVLVVDLWGVLDGHLENFDDQHTVEYFRLGANL